MGVDAQKKWSRIESYGPKFVENIVQAVCEQMGRTPTWIPGLVLKADGYECAFYKKGGRKIFCVYGKNSSLIRNRYV